VGVELKSSRSERNIAEQGFAVSFARDPLDGPVSGHSTSTGRVFAASFSARRFARHPARAAIVCRSCVSYSGSTATPSIRSSVIAQIRSTPNQRA